MKRLALMAALVAAPVFAQDLPAATADQFRDHVQLVTRTVATVALLHDADGAFPSTAFDLLGGREAGRTGLRGSAAAALSALSVENDGPMVSIEIVPLPTAPYEREDDVIRVIVTRDGDGLYQGRYEIQRRAAPEDGAKVLDYDRRDGLVVTRAFGTACVDPAMVREQLAAGTFDAAPGSLGPAPLQIRVHPAAAEPTLFGAGE